MVVDPPREHARPEFMSDTYSFGQKNKRHFAGIEFGIEVTHPANSMEVKENCPADREHEHASPHSEDESGSTREDHPDCDS